MIERIFKNGSLFGTKEGPPSVTSKNFGSTTINEDDVLSEDGNDDNAMIEEEETTTTTTTSTQSVDPLAVRQPRNDQGKQASYFILLHQFILHASSNVI